MKIKNEFLAKEVYSKLLDTMVYVSYENLDLLKNLDVNFIFEIEDKQNDSNSKKSK